MKGRQILVLLVSLFFTSAVIVNTTYAIATFYINPETSTAAPNETFSIIVKVSDVIDLFAWGTRIEFNATLLNVTSVEEGPFLKGQPEGTLWVSNINNTEGYVDIGCTTAGSYPGVSGSGTLATVTFLVKGTGECDLNFYSTELLNFYLNLIPTTVKSGYFTNSPTAHDIAVTGVTASPTTAPAGTIVTINVTVVNQGAFPETFNLTVYNDSEIVERNEGLSVDVDAQIIISIYWNTTGVASGTYPIRAVASPVPREADTADNTLTGGSVTIPGHDIAILNVNNGKTKVLIGEIVSISVTVKNSGNYPETFNVSTYYDTTFIGKQTVTNLAEGTKTTLTFNWNTTNVAPGTYLTKAVVPPLPGETNTANNQVASSWMNAVTVQAPVQSFPFEYVIIAIVVLIAVAGIAGFFIMKRRKAA